MFIYKILLASLGVQRNAMSENVANRPLFILGDVNAESELFASSDVEAQAVVIRSGEEVDDPAESVV